MAQRTMDTSKSVMSDKDLHAVQWPKSGISAVAQAARSSTRDLHRGQQRCLASMADNCISAINSTKTWCCHGNVKKGRALRFLQCQHRRPFGSFHDVSGDAHSCPYDASFSTSDDFTKAIVEENVLEKPTLSSRKKSLRHLVELYGMDPSKAMFRIFWEFGPCRFRVSAPALSGLCVCPRSSTAPELRVDSHTAPRRGS